MSAATARALELAEALDSSVGAFAVLTPEIAAREPAPGPLHGMPLAVKDVIDVAGVPTGLGASTAGARVPEKSAEVVALAQAAGAVVIGKAHTHELALGMITPQTRNPLDTTRIAGGSSGGSAAAVAAGIAAIAFGTDTNGSIRCPASLCGIVGLRPTQGAISRAGVAPLAPSQDTVGLLTLDAHTCAALFAVVATDPPRPAADGPPVVGVERDWIAAAEPDVARACTEAVEALAAGGARLVDVTLPDPALAGSVAAVVLYAEAARAWAGQSERFGTQVRAGLVAGSEVNADAYTRAKRVRAAVLARVRRCFDENGLTAVATPTLPATAATAGATKIESGGKARPIDAVYSRFTALASVTGQPALSVPCGLDTDGLPVGLQLIGRPGGEPELFAIASTLEQQPGARAVAAARAAAAKRLSGAAA